jgi:hypothetical protein
LPLAEWATGRFGQRDDLVDAAQEHTMDQSAPRAPTSDLKFKDLYFRDLSTGIGLLEDGTVVRFIYEGPRGGGNAFTLRVYPVDVKDERGTSKAMFNET